MNTLARQHFARVNAARASAAAGPGLPVDASAYELVLLQLAEDRRRLKAVQSIERKVEVKRQMLPTYLPWIEGALEAGRGGEDAVLTTMMVWAIDVGSYELALRIAAYVLEHGLAMPDQYHRTAATIVAEEIADQALSAFGTDGDFSHGALEIAEQLTAASDMPDEVRAKLHKALGQSFAARMARAAEPAPLGTQALVHLRRALQLNDRVGAKKEIERVERAIKNSTTTGTAERGAPAQGDTSAAGAPAPASG